MADYNIKALECSYEYGNPSGHALGSSFAYSLMLWLWGLKRTKSSSNKITEENKFEHKNKNNN